jgi:membrane protease YdiL (CAAX protease family)
VLCSDYPTQLLLNWAFVTLGYRPFTANGTLSPPYIVVISLTDAALLVALILLFLRAHGERPRDVILGRGPLAREAAAGIPMIFVALAIALAVVAAAQRAAPWLHNVEHNPLQDLLRSPRDAWLFALVVIVAGGVREEIQRAFLLHRFEVWLGGRRVGVVVTSVAFVIGHLLQGADAAIATGLLGAFWGTVYLRRRSAIAPMVSHSGFDLLQIVPFLISRHP